MPTVGKDTLKKLRRLYIAAWSTPWPHDNAYLQELWQEARTATNTSHSHIPSPNAWTFCLELMKEST